MAPKLKGKSLSLAISLIGAVGFILQGYDQAIANGLLILDSFIAVFPQVDTVQTTGREKSHNSKIQAIQASSFSLGQLIAGRVITGLGVGGFTATIPMYVSESSGAEERGRMVLLEGWFAIGGVVFAAWLGFGLSYVSDSSVSWRLPIASQGLFGLIVVGCIMLLPESPRWLARVGRLEEASEGLARMENVAVDSEHVLQELEIIRQSLEIDENAEPAGSSSPFALTKNRHLHRTVIAVGVNILAQMTGVNIITFYSDIIFQCDLGYSGTLSGIITGCLQIWQFLATGVAVLLIDRVGRRPLLIAAAAGMTIAQACLAGLSSDLKNTSMAGASLLFYFVALFCFPIGLFLVPFMYAAEIAPLKTRAQVTAMAAAANWLFNFVLAEVSPVGFATIHWRYYIVYACISAFACVFFYLFCPETKGRTLEEIDDIFVQSKSVFDTVQIARETPYQTEILAHVSDTEKGGLNATQVECPSHSCRTWTDNEINN
ncbi:hypothetical protein DTO039G3_2759 [Penicillium roqueforti]|nr:hypothetical protein DTO039G3_2759 [Penicillium roqueforti]